jgi:hypothetical protein
MPLASALLDVAAERERQDAKWGEQNHDFTVWATVLGEEFGETCHAMLHYRAAAGRAENVEGDTDPAAWLEKVRKEAIQTAAVAVAIVEFIDRGMQPTYHRQAGGGTGDWCAGCGQKWPCRLGRPS